MSLYYCSDCKTAFLPEKTVTDGDHLFCKKCKKELTNLGSEPSKVSLQAHLEAQNITPTSELYHNYKLIKSKHYQGIQKPPFLIDCEEKLNRNPLNTEALFTLTKWYYSQGLKDEALAIAKQIIKIDNTYNKAHEFLSEINANRNNKLLPDDLRTLEDMGINYVESQNLKQAIDVFEKILTINSKHPAAQRYLVEIYTQMNEFNKVIHILNRLSLQFPDDATILFNLAVACFNANDINRAKSNLKAAKEACRSTELMAEIDQFFNHLNK